MDILNVVYIYIYIYMDILEIFMFLYTSASHNFPWYLIGATLGAKNLSAYTTVVSSSKRREPFTTFVALFTHTIWHPITSQLRIFVRT